MQQIRGRMRGWGGDASQSRREHAAGAAGVIYEQIWELKEEQ